VLAVNPQVAGAYANLGVIDMRRKQWPRALEMLRKAEHLAPQIAGIRLNIGLVYYRQNDFRNAIPPFDSVVHDAPDSFQARYLLGLCYFFVERYGDAATTLEPLWSQASSQLNYLYVLGIAAHKAGRADLEQRALGHLVEIGQNSPEFHLLMGKAHLNREEYDEAITKLEIAAKGDPSLPFVHFNLGMAYLKKQDLEHAKAEFLKDIAIEPDVSYDYDQLGQVYYLQQEDQEAEKMFRKALHLDPQLASSHFQLARVYLRKNTYAEALTEVDATAPAFTTYADKCCSAWDVCRRPRPRCRHLRKCRMQPAKNDIRNWNQDRCRTRSLRRNLSSGSQRSPFAIAGLLS
jgi:tetratricopeptide (TPR) repeat protein